MSDGKHAARVPDHSLMDMSQIVLDAFGMSLPVYYAMLGAIFDNHMAGVVGKHRKCDICEGVHVIQDTGIHLFGVG